MREKGQGLRYRVFGNDSAGCYVKRKKKKKKRLWERHEPLEPPSRDDSRLPPPTRRPPPPATRVRVGGRHETRWGPSLRETCLPGNFNKC